MGDWLSEQTRDLKPSMRATFLHEWDQKIGCYGPSL